MQSESATQEATPHSWLSFVATLYAYWRLILGLPLLTALFLFAASYLFPNWYSASAKLAPPQQGTSSALAMLGQLGALASGAGQALGLKSPSDIYVAILKSRTVADNLVKRFELTKVYGEDYLVDARKELADNSAISANRDGTISIFVEDKDPKRAADIANAYIEELRARTRDLAITEASQRRLFFESQLAKAKQDLTNAEQALKSFSQESGLVSVQGQIGASVTASATLRAQITAKEIQVSSMRTFATEANPEIQRSLRELAALRTELAKLENDPQATRGDAVLPFGKVPEAGLQFARKLRDVKYHEALFEALAKQYEIARIDEARDFALVQVIDHAVPPEKKSKPYRGVLSLVGFLVALLIALSGAFLLEALPTTSPSETTQMTFWKALHQMRGRLKGRST